MTHLDTLFKIGTAVKTVLLEPEKKFNREHLDRLIAQNNEYHGVLSSTGVLYAGRFYFPSTHRHSAMSARQSKAVHSNLLLEFGDCIKQQAAAELEVQLIWQSMVPLFQYHLGIPHRDAVPDELATHITDLAKTCRKFTFDEVLGMAKPADVARFRAMQPRMQHYLALRMAI